MHMPMYASAPDSDCTSAWQISVRRMDPAGRSTLCRIAYAVSNMVFRSVKPSAAKLQTESTRAAICNGCDDEQIVREETRMWHLWHLVSHQRASEWPEVTVRHRRDTAV